MPNTLLSCSEQAALCTGPLETVGKDGCFYCSLTNDTEEEVLIYTGSQCPICFECNEGCRLQFGDDEEEFDCIKKYNINS